MNSWELKNVSSKIPHFDFVVSYSIQKFYNQAAHDVLAAGEGAEVELVHAVHHDEDEDDEMKHVMDLQHHFHENEGVQHLRDVVIRFPQVAHCGENYDAVRLVAFHDVLWKHYDVRYLLNY